MNKSPVSHNKAPIVLSISMLVILSITCAIPGTSGGSNNDATLAAMSLQGTSLALQATQEAINLQATNAVLPTEPPPMITEIPPITVPPPFATEAPPTPFIQPGQSMDLDALRKGAKILLFEDMSGNRYKLERYVKRALDEAGYVYTDVGSAQGWLKKELVSPAEYDLLIISSEITGKISGEYFDYIDKRLQEGAGVIMEMWDIDSMSLGKIKKILDQCGVEVEADWYNPGMRDLWYLIRDHPILNEPNEMGTLRPNRVWTGDVGDLMQIKYYNDKAVGDAAFVIGIDPSKPDSRAVLTTCMGGRLVLQTFDTHEYSREDMLKLWQNYVYYSLTNHFVYTQK